MLQVFLEGCLGNKITTIKVTFVKITPRMWEIGY